MRTYARVAGLALVLVGLVGLSSRTGLFFLPDLNLSESFFHVSVGLMYVYAGFLQRDLSVVRSVVGGLGVLLLVSKGVVITTGLLYGEDHDLFNPIEVTCLVVGISSVLVARYLKDDDRTGAED